MTETDQTFLLPRLRAFDQPSAVQTTDRWQRYAPSTPTPNEKRAVATLTWLVPTLVTLGLCLVRLPWAGLSGDELSVWGFAKTPWPQALRQVSQLSPTVAPYDLLIHSWANLVGTSEFALRLPSVLAMVVACGLLASLCRRLSGVRAGLAAGLLFAAVPAVSRFGQTAGPYSIVVLSAVAATYALVVLFDESSTIAWYGRVGRFAGYALSLAALGLCTPPGLIALIVAHLAVLLFMRPRVVVPWLAAAIVGAAPAAWLWLQSKTTWRGTAGAIHATSANPAEASTLIFGSALVAGAVIALAVLGYALSRPVVLYTAGALVPLVVLLAWRAFSPLDLGLPLFVTMPAWIGAAALLMSRYTVSRGIITVAAVAVIGVPIQTAIRQADGHGEATRSLASVLASNEQPGDAIVYGPTDATALVGRDLVARYVPTNRQPKDVFALTAPRRDGRIYPAECASAGSCLDNTTKRVWVLRADGATDPLAGMPASKDGALRVNFTVSQSWGFTGLSLTLFVRPAGK